MARTSGFTVCIAALGLCLSARAGADQALAPSATHDRAPTIRPVRGLGDLIRFHGLKPITLVGAGQNEFRVSLQYGEALVPGSLNVRVNGVDVTEKFSMEAGQESVNLPLRSGNNRIDFYAAARVDGNEEHRVQTFFVNRSAEVSPVRAQGVPAPLPR